MAVFDRLLVVQPQEPVDAALNMAIDEAILEWAPSPTIRFYGWSRPSISFGYFGKFDDVSEFGETHDLVRRWTGGGIVFHDKDQTYSIAVPAPASAKPADSVEIYGAVHTALRNALNHFKLGADIVVQRPSTSSNACFVSPVLADVVVGDRKVAGAAHRRTKAGLLHQGSIQNLTLPPTLAQVFARHLSDQPETLILPDSVRERAAAISTSKYGTVTWLKRR